MRFFRDSSAALASLFILEKGNYPIKHAVDVAVISDVMVRKRGMDSDNQGPLMAAALTMNIGMLSLQEVLYQQEKDLTSEQKKLIDSHPAQSVVMLREAKVTDRLWLKCVLAHHEKIDGTAYPNQLSGEQYHEET